VKALEEVYFTAPTSSMTKPKTLTEEQVHSILNSTNEVILASQPAHPARRTLPHFTSISERSQAFQSARFNAIWHRQPAAFQVLGNIYIDWGAGAKALDAYNKMLSLNPMLQNSASLLTNLGESYRLIGEIDKAEQLVIKALNLNQAWAPALNALGNIYIARARIAYRNEDLDTAKELLNNAAIAYEQSFRYVARHSKPMEEWAGLGTSSSNMASLGTIFEEVDSLTNSLIFVKAGRALYVAQQNSSEQQNQSRGVTKVNIGDAKALLADIARKEDEPEEAARLYKEARQAYLEAKRFYPQYPYMESGLNRVSQAIQALPRPRVTPTPTPRVETPQTRYEKKLDVPIRKAPPGDNALTTATSIAAAVSYLGDLDVEPCEVLGLMHRGYNCCHQEDECPVNTYDAAMNAVRRFRPVYDLPADLTESISYLEIVASIDRGLPVVVLGDRLPTLVISGYSAPSELIVLVPSDGERSISYKRLTEYGWQMTIRFQRRRLVPTVHAAFAQSANEIVEIFLNEDFDEVSKRFTPNLKGSLTPRMLEAGWDKLVAPIGPFVERGTPRIRSKRNPFEVYVRCRFRRGIIYLVIRFDRSGNVDGLNILPQNRDIEH